MKLKLNRTNLLRIWEKTRSKRKEKKEAKKLAQDSEKLSKFVQESGKRLSTIKDLVAKYPKFNNQNYKPETQVKVSLGQQLSNIKNAASMRSRKVKNQIIDCASSLKQELVEFQRKDYLNSAVNKITDDYKKLRFEIKKYNRNPEHYKASAKNKFKEAYLEVKNQLRKISANTRWKLGYEDVNQRLERISDNLKDLNMGIKQIAHKYS